MTASVRPAGCTVSASRRVADASLEPLKWLGIVFMTLDHTNKYLLDQLQPWMFDAGRMALPMFATVLGLNLARGGAPLHRRVATRLAVWGALASIPHVALGAVLGGWWPLNILATFLVAVGVIALLDRGHLAAAALTFLAGSLLVEYWWPGVAICVAAWAFGRRQSALHLGAWLLSIASLTLINSTWWAMAAIPVIAAAVVLDWRLPRCRDFFYGYYAVHLVVIALVARS